MTRLSENKRHSHNSVIYKVLLLFRMFCFRYLEPLCFMLDYSAAGRDIKIFCKMLHENSARLIENLMVEIRLRWKKNIRMYKYTYMILIYGFDVG